MTFAGMSFARLLVGDSVKEEHPAKIIERINNNMIFILILLSIAFDDKLLPIKIPLLFSGGVVRKINLKILAHLFSFYMR